MLVPLSSPGVDPSARAYDNSRFLELRGVRTHVLAWEPEGRPAATVVAHHHFLGAARTFDAMGRRLASEGVRVLAFDRVGFGLTERVDPAGQWIGKDAPYTRAFAVEQTVELLDVMDVDRAIVMGTSMGGTTTIQFALEHPERVSHLVPTAAALVGDSSPPPPVRALLRSRFVRPIATRVVEKRAEGADPSRVTGAWLDPSRATAQDIAAHLDFIGVRGWAEGMVHKFASDVVPNLPPLLPRLRGASFGVTAVGGSADPIIRPRYVRKVAELTGGTAVLLTCGHVVHQEASDALAEVVLTAVRANA